MSADPLRTLTVPLLWDGERLMAGNVCIGWIRRHDAGPWFAVFNAGPRPAPLRAPGEDQARAALVEAAVRALAEKATT